MTSSQPKLVLYYWPFKGRAQAVRDAFYLGKIPFEDNTSQNFGVWKDQPEQLPLGQWPILDVDGVRYTESNAILTYAGRRSGLIPTDALEEMRVQEILNIVEDFFGAMGPTFRLKGQELLDARKAFCDGPAKKFIALLVKRLQQNAPSVFFVGNSLTIADLKVFAPFEMVASGFFDGVQKDLFTQHAPFAAWGTAVTALVHAARPKVGGTLIYWKLKARGWPVAVLARAGGFTLKWDDQTANAWPASKDKAPFGQLPLLEYEGKTYAQSGALYRFVARKCNLEGANDHEFALNSMLIEEYQDCVASFGKTMYVKDDAARAAAWTDTEKATLTQLQYLEKLIDGTLSRFSPSRLLVGDILMVCLFNIVTSLFPTILTNTPKLAKFYETNKNLIAADESIGHYYEKK